MGTVVDSLDAAVAKTGVSVVVRTGYSMAELLVGSVVLPAEGGGPEDTACVICFLDDAISVEVQWFVDRRHDLALLTSLEGVHFEALGEMGQQE